MTDRPGDGGGPKPNDNNPNTNGAESDDDVSELDDDDFDWSDEDDEEFIAAWEEAEGDAVELLRETLSDQIGREPPREALGAAVDRLRTAIRLGDWPVRHAAKAAGFEEDGVPDDDVELWLGVAGGLVCLNAESGLGPSEDALLAALQFADWAGAVIGAVRAGPGAPVEPANLADYAEECPEIEGELDEDDRDFIEGAFHLIQPVWVAAGAVDGEDRLTPLGAWGLPRALAWAWNGDFDDPDDDEGDDDLDEE